MPELTVDRESLLQEVLDAIRELVLDPKLYCSTPGFLQIRSDAFKQFRCDREFFMCINIRTMTKMFQSLAINDDIVTIKADHNSDTVSFILGGSVKYDMKLMERFLGFKPEKYDAALTMSSVRFSYVCKDFPPLGGDTVRISITEEGGGMFSTTSDWGTYDFPVPPQPEFGTTVEVKKPVSLTFALKHMIPFKKACRVSEFVTIYLSSKWPSVVEYQIDENIGYVRFYLDPEDWRG